MVTLDDVRHRLRRIEGAVAELTAMLDELETTPAYGIGPPLISSSAPCAGSRLPPYPPSERAALREAVRTALRSMELPDIEPMDAEQIQASLRERGIAPEDNILSRGIVEMREE